MISWVLWCVLVLQLFVFEGVVAAQLAPVLDLAVALCLFMALFARPATVPGLLITTAIARAALVPGSPAFHVLALGIPVAVLLPLRGILSRQVYLWQCAATAFLAVTQPGLMRMLGRLTGEEGVAAGPLDAQGLFWALLTVPPLVWTLRSLPPLSRFQERSE